MAYSRTWMTDLLATCQNSSADKDSNEPKFSRNESAGRRQKVPTDGTSCVVGDRTACSAPLMHARKSDLSKCTALSLVESAGLLCTLPRLRAVSDQQRQPLEYLFKKHLQSLESSKKFLEGVFDVKRRCAQPNNEPLLPRKSILPPPSVKPPLAKFSPFNLQSNGQQRSQQRLAARRRQSTAADTEPAAGDRPLQQQQQRRGSIVQQRRGSLKPTLTTTDDETVEKVMRMKKTIFEILRSRIQQVDVKPHPVTNTAVDSRASTAEALCSHLCEVVLEDALKNGWNQLNANQLENQVLLWAMNPEGIATTTALLSGLVFVADPNIKVTSLVPDSSPIASTTTAVGSLQDIGPTSGDSLKSTKSSSPACFTWDSDHHSDCHSDSLPTTGNVRRQLMCGRMQHIPVIQSRVIRLYITSNYNDMKNERNKLLRDVTPKLQAFCESNELQFQMVDIRWGVTEEMMSDPTIIHVCREQIELSHRYSSGPFLAVFIGNNYGNVALPLTFNVELFRTLCDIKKTVKVPNGHLLEEWYTLDTNAIPPVYTLLPVTSHFKNFGLQFYTDQAEQLKRTALRQWSATQMKLRQAIDQLFHAAMDLNVISPANVELFSQSQMEVRTGLHIISQSQSPYLMCYVRQIDSVQFYLNEKLAPKFVDVVERNSVRTVDHVKQRRLATLKASLEELKAEFMLRRYRHYRGELWELPPETEADVEEAAVKHERKKKEIEVARKLQENRVFEDPFYLQQYNINWGENVEIRNENAEYGAFLTAANELYLERVAKDFVHDCQELVVSYFHDLQSAARSMDRLQEEIIHHIQLLITCNLYNPSVRFPNVDSKSEPSKLSNVGGIIQKTESEVEKLTSNSWRLKTIKESLLRCTESRCPLVLHGPPGCGRTALIAAISEFSRSWLQSPNAVVVSRVLGSSRGGSTIDHVLSTVCHQICAAYAVRVPGDISQFSSYQRYFSATLQSIASCLSETSRLVLLFDGLDQLLPNFNAHSLFWLPETWPRYVTVVMTTETGHQQTMRNVKCRIERICRLQQPGLEPYRADRSKQLEDCMNDENVGDFCFVKIEPLDQHEQKQMVDVLLQKDVRQLSVSQHQLVMDAIAKCPTPLYISMIMKDAVKWTSSDPSPFESDLPESVVMAFERTLTQLEAHIGPVFVSHALSYVTIATDGLSETELEDVLSCDDDVLREVFYFTDPPLSTVIRLPQMFVARLRYQLNDILVPRFDYGLPVFFWAHRSFADVVRNKYLHSKDAEGRINYTDLYYYCNRQLADLFFANGDISKELLLPARHMVIQNISRHVTARPLNPSNHRKLYKLPIHLYHSAPEVEVIDEFKQKILCNVTWLWTKLQSRPFYEVLSDFDLVRVKDSDIRSIEEILRSSELMSTNISLFLLQLLARFSRDPNANSPIIGKMVREVWHMVILSEEQLLLPMYPCISPTAISGHRVRKIGPTQILAANFRLRKLPTENDTQLFDEENEELSATQMETDSGHVTQQEPVTQDAIVPEENSQQEDVEQISGEVLQPNNVDSSATGATTEPDEQYQEQHDTLAVVWGANYGLTLWQGNQSGADLQPLQHLHNQVDMSNVVVSHDATVAFTTKGTVVTYWQLTTGKIQWQIDASSVDDGHQDTYASEAAAFPMAINYDHNKLVVLLVTRDRLNRTPPLNRFLVFDVENVTAVETIDDLFVGEAEFQVEFLRKDDSLMICYSWRDCMPCTATTSETTDVSTRDSVIHDDDDDESMTTTAILFDNLTTSGAAMARLALPSRRNHAIPCAVYRSNVILIGCTNATVLFGDIIAVVRSTDNEYELKSVSPPCGDESNDNCGDASDRLQCFVVTDNGQLIAVYNNSTTSVLRIKDLQMFLDSVSESSANATAWNMQVTPFEKLQASCLTLSVDQEAVYVGYKHFGAVKKYSVATGRQLMSVVVNSGDVLTLLEVRPNVIYVSGSDCTICCVENNRLSISQIARPLAFARPSAAQPQSKLPADELLYNGLSEGVTSFCHVMRCDKQLLQPNRMRYSLIVCQVSRPFPRMVNVRGALKLKQLPPLPFDDISHFSKIVMLADGSFALGLAIINNTEKQIFPASGILQLWDMKSVEQRPVVTDNSLFADLFCVSPSGRNIAMFRHRLNTDNVGGSMAVYNADVDRFTHNFVTRRRLPSVSRLLLSCSLHFMVTVEPERVCIWRLVHSNAVDGYNNYVTNHPNQLDDVSDDNDGVFFDDSDLMELQLTKMSNELKDHRVCYVLRFSAVATGAVELTDDDLLIIGTCKGNLLTFDLSRVMNNVKDQAGADRPRDGFGNLSPAEVRRRCGCMPPVYQPTVEADNLKQLQTPSSAYIFYGTDDGNQEELLCRKLPGIEHEASVTIVCLSGQPRQQYVVCGSADGTLTVFDRVQDDRQATLVGHRSKVLCACISPDNRYITSGSADFTIRVWRLMTGRTVALFDTTVAAIHKVVWWEDDDNQPRIAALTADWQTKRHRLMLFKAHNIFTASSAEDL